MKSEEIKVNITSRATHRGLERSTTLNRRYVKRPTKLTITDGTEAVEAKAVKAETEAPKVILHKAHKISIDDGKIERHASISRINIQSEEDKIEGRIEQKPVVIETPDLPPAPNPYQAALDARKKENAKREQQAISSRALKDAAIARALNEMEAQKAMQSQMTKKERSITEKVMRSEMEETAKMSKKEAKRAKKAEKETIHLHKKKNRTKRFVLALAASTACVLALGMFVRVNLPDISVTVAAIQTGIDAKYPKDVPGNFRKTDVYANNEGAVVIEFTSTDDKKFTLYEEKSSWDSNALLNNYVRAAYGDNYDIIREQGTTVYINYSNAAWVKNGIAYKITANPGILTKRQIKRIVTSL